MEHREPGIDLVRITGLFFVVGVHFFLYNGFYYENQQGAAIWLADCLRWLFFSCNGIFMMLTGYLRCGKALSRGYYRCLVPALKAYIAVALISMPLRQFVFGDTRSLTEWIGKFFGFGGAYYGWYIGMYIGLIFLSPVINLAIANLDPQKLTFLTLSFLTATALPSLTALELFPSWWEGSYPLTYYLIGAAIANLRPKISPLICWSAALGTALFLGTVTYFTATSTCSTGFTQGYGGFFITAIAVSVFLGTYRANPGRKVCAALKWFSGAFPEGYLLSHLLDAWVYNLFPQWKTPEKYPIAFFALTIPIFCFSAVFGKLLHSLLTKITIKRKTPR